MFGASRDGIIVAAFFTAFVVVTAAEIFWLANKQAVPIKKALTAVFLPNFLTITLGFLVAFIGFGILLGAVSNDDTDISLGARAMFIAAAAFPFLLLAGTKRLLIAGMRIGEIARPLLYSIVFTLIFFAAVCGLPAIFIAFR